jgi:spore germination protein GerM
VAAACLLVLAACGVQLDDEPRPLATENVPYGLLDPPTTSPTGSADDTLARPRALQAVSVYLVDNDGFLVEVRRPVTEEPDVEAAVTSLLSPLTEAERNAGLATAVASTTGLRGVIGPEGGLVTIDLSSAVGDGSPDIVRVALAQLVYTATAVPGVQLVLFQVDGEAREVPTGQGRSTAEPLSRTDYRQLERPPPSPTTPDAPSLGG